MESRAADSADALFVIEPRGPAPCRFTGIGAEAVGLAMVDIGKLSPAVVASLGDTLAPVPCGFPVLTVPGQSLDRPMPMPCGLARLLNILRVQDAGVASTNQLQILQSVVDFVLVAVMKLEPIRNRTVRVFPDDLMQRPSIAVVARRPKVVSRRVFRLRIPDELPSPVERDFGGSLLSRHRPSKSRASTHSPSAVRKGWSAVHVTE